MTPPLSSHLRVPASPRPRVPRSGVVLIIVLVVLIVLALAAYTFCELMVTHRESAQLSGKQMQARALVDSGVESVKIFLVQDRATRQEAGGVFDNPETFQGIVVLADPNPKLRGSFTVLASNLDDMGNLAGVRYGLQDESARLNLNALITAEKQMPDGGRTLLMALPGMTIEIADAIMDWLDADEETREYGAEADYYSGLDPPYGPKNGPFETVEELLLVRGVTPQLLFGLDSNRNGAIDPHEETNAGSLDALAMPTTTPQPASGSTGSLVEEGATNPAAGEVLELGWSAYLTLYSQERNVDSQGNPRVYLNQDDLQLLHDELTERCGAEWANFIVAYRQNGPSTGSEKGASAATVSLDLTKAGNTKFVQILDLIGAKTQVPGADGESPTVLSSPFPLEGLGVFLPKLMDLTTTSQAKVIPGRININQAPRAILMGIPGLTEEIVNAILEKRETAPDGSNPNHNYETWLIAEAVVTLEEFKPLFPFINAGGDVFRAQIVGYYQGGGASSRAEVIFDATTAEPRVLFLRDVSHLGRGYALETLGVEFSETP